MEQIERNEYPLPQEETLDIKKLFFQVLGNWYWFAISIFAGLFISYLVNRYSEQIYSVRSSLIVKDDENTRGLSGAENLIQGLKLVRNTKSVQNEIGILKSYTVAYQAISELPDFWVSYVAVGRRGIKESKLYTGCPFVVTYDSLTANITNYPAFVTILSPDSYLLEIDDGMNVRKKMKFGERFTNHAFDFAINLRFDVK
ncbi:MAG TPA: Wzz/FepE/Etk N-terminal domain-containing protein, partial [Tenuifilaceae bacterium]|nr:Wzz/FepE/Etk N-terminal domain-containing protein [Tenuifilaceae bacterium]